MQFITVHPSWGRKLIHTWEYNTSTNNKHKILNVFIFFNKVSTRCPLTTRELLN